MRRMGEIFPTCPICKQPVDWKLIHELSGTNGDQNPADTASTPARVK